MHGMGRLPIERSALATPASPDRPAFCDRRFDGRIQRQSDATNYGGGALLAYAAGPWFATLSLVYLDSQARDQDTDVQAFTATPRLGWRSAPLPSGRLALYAGASFVGCLLIGLLVAPFWASRLVRPPSVCL